MYISIEYRIIKKRIKQYNIDSTITLIPSMFDGIINWKNKRSKANADNVTTREVLKACGLYVSLKKEDIIQ